MNHVELLVANILEIIFLSKVAFKFITFLCQKLDLAQLTTVAFRTYLRIRQLTNKSNDIPFQYLRFAALPGTYNQKVEHELL